jgi:tRNA U54 and U55 pseudouridine synthase Pus10
MAPASDSTTSPCRNCLAFLDPKKKHISDSSIADDSTSCCPVCLGLWQDDKSLLVKLENTIKAASEPYGGLRNSSNTFSAEHDPPSISLPGDVAFRYLMASTMPQYKGAKEQHAFIQQLKCHVNDLLRTYIEKLEKQKQAQNKQPEKSSSEYPSYVLAEEQGYLALHLHLTPRNVPRPPAEFIPKRNNKKVKKKRFETQGGSPRSNLERRLEKDGTVLWPLSQAVEISTQKKRAIKASEHDWYFQETANGEFAIRSVPMTNEGAIKIHVALWRRPFLVQGSYTKTRRDVSQTPFFINADNPKKRQRLGFSSIEEQILPTLTERCGGISTFNNNPDSDNVVFGKAKFHASGREDMDVRMILPPVQHSDNNNKNISGRPFCCEVIDALRLPTVEDLKNMVETINHTGPIPGDDEHSLLPISDQYYGRSPLGVGIEPATFAFAPGEAFKNLQSETEQKHKYYGCLCWSEEVLPPQEALAKRLTIKPDGKSLFPLELHQRTPIRVLHRRANAVRIRHVVSCPHVERLGDHYFRLHISTDAGTYVKEFCHGDLGRTQPNVSALLDCGKTDILELDCEGIQIN